MAEKQPSAEEALDQFPELKAARNAYISLLADQHRMFMRLGYSRGDIITATAVTSLIAEEGEVVTVPSPYLVFRSAEETKFVSIIPFRNNAGYNLYVTHDFGAEFNIANPEASPEEKMLHSIFFCPKPLEIEVNLLEKTGEEILSLQDLVSLFYEKTIKYEGFRAVKKENRLSTIKKLMKIATYKARWLDENTKRDFVLKLDLKRGSGNQIIDWWRRLDDFQYHDKNYQVWGKKKSSNDQMEKLLIEDAPVIEGRLVLGYSGVK